MRPTADWISADLRHLWHPFTQYDEWVAEPKLVIERAEGVTLVDTDGRRYLDAVSSLWCNLFGHRNPRIDAAVRDQLDRVAHTTLLGLASTPSIALAERLCALTGMDRVFYSDSGSTSVEVALKMAFQAQQQRGHTARVKFAALAEAYHGDTLGSVSVGGIDLFHGVYRPLLFEAVRVPCPDRADPVVEAALLERAAAIFREHGPTLAAFVFEPLVQGAAGLRMHSPAFLRALCALARDAGALLVADEVATGFGRTGTLFAIEQAGVRPDLLCVAKGLTGGYLPLAATLTTDAVFDAFRGSYTEWKTLFHGHTYTGNALACAAALATLGIFEEDSVLTWLPERVRVLDEALRAIRHPAIREVRTFGMMGAVVLGPFEPAARTGHRVALACRDEGVILRCLGDTVVLMPPLIMTDEDLSTCARAIETALARVCPA
jgi:adenosylmethionine-8-amino-7-oxononanoate aminotransferase